ncbi:MAG: KaiC domain-containing protein [Pyrobaculum sp.]|uniref:KaiC domain-containing protein n=1 Tax=unclassified Pyrobaculum TaxID=2643434 RepID=UPI0021D95679|nr:KaiC domain-containing protein [Pyrobaculum sp. 3827-6]MCU7788588.1 KaiC domain-containing protein [Pyrobaculum sp. 3827-6]
MKRISTGVEELDKALEGGIPQGSWVVATGEPGVGKSILCIHFAYAGLRAGDPVVYVTTEQEFRDVMEQAKQLGMDFAQYAAYNIAWKKEPEELPEIVVIDIFGLLKVARQLTERAREESPEKVRRYAALSIDTLIEAINEAYKILAVAGERGTPERHVRLVIDSMSAFWVDKPVMARKYSYQLKIATHRDNVTALLTSQYAPTTRQAYGFGLEHIADGVIHMWMDEVETAKEVRRWLIIKKMRMTAHETKAFKVRIESGRGLVLEKIS